MVVKSRYTICKQFQTHLFLVASWEKTKWMTFYIFLGMSIERKIWNRGKAITVEIGPATLKGYQHVGWDWLRNTYGPCIILAWGRFGNSLTISTRHLAYPPLWWSVYLCLLPSHILPFYSLLLLRACWAFVKSNKGVNVNR